MGEGANGKIVYVPSLSDNLVFRSTSWMLSKAGMSVALVVLMVLWAVLLAVPGVRESEWVRIHGPMMLPAVLLVALALPYLSQRFRSVAYYAKPFFAIRRIVQSHRRRQPRLLYLRPRALIAFTAIGLAVVGTVVLIAVYARSLGNLGAALIGSGALATGTHVARRFARSADQVQALSDTPPVLLLRSFADDRGLEGWDSQALYTETFERAVGRVFRPFGPFVAIGKPGERLAPIGAARTYASDEEWQTKALDLMRSSKIILMLAGTTEGLKWELTRIVQEGHHRKLLLLMPPVSDAQRRARLNSLASSLAGTAWHEPLLECDGRDVVTVQLAEDCVVVLVTAPGYRQHPTFFREAVYVGLYGLWREN